MGFLLSFCEPESESHHGDGTAPDNDGEGRRIVISAGDIYSHVS